MTDEPLEHRERSRHGCGIAAVVVFLLSPLLYVLSPPLVALIFGRQVFENLPWLWWPVLWLELNSELYRWYLESFPEWIWR